MDAAHHLILICGALGLLSIAAGLLSARFGAPLLLVFLAIGMLAGEDGLGGIVFSDFRTAYLIGSVALAFILFEGGLRTRRAALEVALWPAITLATAGVVITAAIVGAVLMLMLLLFIPPGPEAIWPISFLVGASLAPTDAAAVALLLRRAMVAVPERVAATLEIESGLNDPISVFLTALITSYMLAPDSVTTGHVFLLLAREMVGGAVLGVVGGCALLVVLRRLNAEAALFPAVALMSTLALFGAAQSVEASGFLAVYLAGVVVSVGGHRYGATMNHFFEAVSWLAQIVLFLMLGLLVTPHQLSVRIPIVGVIATLLLLARPVACLICLLPFGFSLRETAFMSWVGLRGAVPIYLTIIPLLAGVHGAEILFSPTFLVVVISLAVQGWTIAPIARLLGFR